MLSNDCTKNRKERTFGKKTQRRKGSTRAAAAYGGRQLKSQFENVVQTKSYEQEKLALNKICTYVYISYLTCVLLQQSKWL